MSPRAAKLLPPLVVAVLTLVTFLPALRAGEFLNWDENEYFLANPHYRGLSLDHLEWMVTTFHYGGYYPVAWLTWGFDYVLWGMDPFGYRLSNVVLHAVVAVLVYVAILEFLGNRSARLAAMAGALFFSIHPLRVESVAWIVERRAILAGGFWLATVLLYVRSRESSRKALLWWAVATFALSLLSKGMAITLPLLLLVLDSWPLRRYGREPIRRILLEKVPFVIVAGAVGLLARLAQVEGGPVRSFTDHPVSARLAQGAYSLVFYVHKTVLPLDLVPLYPLEQELQWTEPRFLAAAAAVLMTTVILWRLRRRASQLWIAWIAYAITILPVSGLAQSGPQLVADRYSYASCIPFAILFAALMVRIRRPVAGFSAGAWIAFLGTLTFVGCAVWHDSITLWKHVVAHFPRGVQAHQNLGNALNAKGRYEEALVHYEKCTTLRPGYAPGWLGVGRIRENLGRLHPARDALREANRLAPDDRNTLYALAVVGMKLGRHDDVARYCNRILARHPDFVHAYTLLAASYHAQGRRAEARRMAEAALRIDRRNPQATSLLEELNR